MDKWEKLDQQYDCTIVCATISPLGMHAFHTGPAVLTPNNDYICGTGKTFKAGMFGTLSSGMGGQLEVRPGYEQLFRDQPRMAGGVVPDSADEPDADLSLPHSLDQP